MINRRNLLAAAAGAVPLPALSQGSKSPLVGDRPVRIIVPMAAGSGTDAVARLMAQQLTGPLGVPVVVDNRPGGATIIGHMAALQSPADGHTMVFTTNGPVLVTPLINSGAKYTYKSFSPVCGVNRAALVLFTSAAPDAPKTFPDLVAKLKQGNGTFASPGVGTLSHLVPELVLLRIGLKASPVPYKDSAQGLQETASGFTDFACDAAIAGLSLVKAGRLQPLAVTGHARLRTMPEVPTLNELGVKGVDVGAASMLLAPAGLSKAHADFLSGAVAVALKSDELSNRLTSLDAPPAFLTPEQLGEQLRTEEGMWSELIRALAIPKQ